MMMTERPTKHHKSEHPPITFSAEDAQGVSQPHDDTLVVTLVILNYITHRILINNGSLTDILYLPAFNQMGIKQDRLKPIQTPLVGFTGNPLLPLGTVSLSFTAGIRDRQVTWVVDFLVVDCPSAYNAILRRPTLN